MKLSLFNLNLHGFDEWEKRFPQIIHILKKKKPDIITLQEVHSDQHSNAIDLINEKLLYPHKKYQSCFNFSGDYGKGILIDSKTGEINNTEEGLGIISTIPFSCSTIHLPIKQGQDRRPRIGLQANFKNFSLLNIHYSPSHSSLIQQENVLKHHQCDIIVGDFNIQPGDLKIDQYQLSYHFSPYISYPHLGQTFDYCLLKKDLFVKQEIFGDLSDHVGLYREIEMNDYSDG